MKKMFALLLVAMTCLSLCACGGSESTSGDNKEDSGFTPTITTETEETEDTKNAETVVEIDENNLEQYYDTTQFIGTPRLAKMQSTPQEDTKTVYLIERDENYNTMCQCVIEMTGSKSDWINKENTGWKVVDCIIVDNNTPNDYSDDVVAYIFMD